MRRAPKLLIFALPIYAACGVEPGPEENIPAHTEALPDDPSEESELPAGPVYVRDQLHLQEILEDYFNPENRPPLRIMDGRDESGMTRVIEYDPIAEWNRIVAKLNLDFSRFVDTEYLTPEDYDPALPYFDGSFAPTRAIVFDTYYLRNGSLYTGYVMKTVSGQVTNYVENRPNLHLRPNPQIGGVFPVRSHTFTGANYTGPSLAQDRWMAYGVNRGRYTITGTDPADVKATWGWRTAWNDQFFPNANLVLTYPDNCCEAWNVGQNLPFNYDVVSRVGTTEAVEVTLRVVGDVGMISSNFPRLMGDENLGLMASSQNMAMRTATMKYAAENKTVSARYAGVLAQLNRIACPVAVIDSGKKCEFNLQTIYAAEKMAGRVTDNLARVEIVLHVNIDYLDRPEYGPWVCSGMSCTTPWGRSGQNREGTMQGWIRNVLGNQNYYFVQHSRGNDDSPAAGRPGDGQLNLSAIENAIGQLYPQTRMPVDCRNQLARELTRHISTGYFFENKLALLNQTASTGLACPGMGAAVPAAQRVLYHLIQNDNSAYEVTAQTYAFGFNNNEINTGTLIEFTSGRYADSPSKPSPQGGTQFKFCAELTAANVTEPTVCGVQPPCPMGQAPAIGPDGGEECLVDGGEELDAGEEADTGDPYWEPDYPDAEPPYLFPDASADPDVDLYDDDDAGPMVGYEDASMLADAWVPPPYDAGNGYPDAWVPPPYDAGNGYPDAWMPPPYDAGNGYPDAWMPPPWDAGNGYPDAWMPPPWDAGNGYPDAWMPPPWDAGNGYPDAWMPPPWDAGHADAGDLDAQTPDADASDAETPDALTHTTIDGSVIIAGANGHRIAPPPPPPPDVLSNVSNFSISYPEGVTSTSNFLDQRGTINYAAATLRIGDLTNPPHGGNFNLHLVIYNVENGRTRVWKRCRANVRVHNGALQLVQWYDCERLQFWNLIPIRTNVADAQNTARVRPATFRYGRPPRDPCLANETVGEQIEHSGQFGIMLRHGSDGTNNVAFCRNCHQDRPNRAPPAGALFCQGLPPPMGETFGNGSARMDNAATADVNEGPTGARDPAMKPMDNGAVLPLVRYLMGKRSPVRTNANYNEYLIHDEGMNRHINDFNKWFCANTPVRYSRFPQETAVIEMVPQTVTNAYFRLVTNGDDQAWRVETARMMCPPPNNPPGTE